MTRAYRTPRERAQTRTAIVDAVRVVVLVWIAVVGPLAAWLLWGITG